MDSEEGIKIYNITEEIKGYQKEIAKLKQENKQLKFINEEYERLNKENRRGFKITSIKEYDVYELLKYKNNWDKLKEFINLGYYDSYMYSSTIINKMQELEKSDKCE